MLIEKTFTMHPENSSVLVADAFGIQEDWENKVVDVEVPDVLPSVTLITGESGCGKSTLLGELISRGLVARPPEFVPPSNPLHSWAASEDESLMLLSAVGLNDAALFCLRYDQLSDSQQARARMYSMLISGAKDIVVDEFLATLDRETAKALAFSFQKLVRKRGLRLIAVTAQTDLEPYLRPDVWIQGKAFPSRWEVSTKTYSDDNPFEVSIDFLKDTVVREERRDKITGKKTSLGYAEGTTTEGKDRYRASRLAELHYKGKYSGGTCDYLFAMLGDKEVGVLVGSKPMGLWTKFKRMRITRLVVHPTYRGCGIGQALVRRYLAAYEEVDTVAAMARFNPVFEKAGMVHDGESVHKANKRLQETLEARGFKEDKWISPKKCEEFCNGKLNREALAEHANLFYSQFNPGDTHSGEPVAWRIEQTKAAIIRDEDIATRLLWRARPHTMAKFIYRKSN